MLSTFPVGKFHVAHAVAMPEATRANALGKRVPWHPGLNYVAFRDNTPQSTGLPAENPPSNWTLAPPPDLPQTSTSLHARLLVFNTPTPKVIFSGALPLGKRLIPAKMSLQSSEIVCDIDTTKWDKTGKRVFSARWSEHVVNLIASGKIMPVFHSTTPQHNLQFSVKEDITPQDWSTLGYSWFSSDLPPVKKWGTPPAYQPCLIVPSHDLPYLLKLFPKSEFVTGCAKGTIWSKLNVPDPSPAAPLIPWLGLLGGPTQIVAGTMHSSGTALARSVWVPISRLPKIKKLPRNPLIFHSIENDSPSTTAQLLGIEVAGLRFQTPVEDKVFTTTKMLQGARYNQPTVILRCPEDFVPKSTAASEFKSYELKKLPVVRSFAVIGKSGEVTMHDGKAGYLRESLEQLRRARGPRKTRKYYEAKYQPRAIPSNFWNYNESEIAEASLLWDRVAAGQMVVSDQPGCVPISALRNVMGEKGVRSPIGHETFYPRVPLAEFFGNQQWVSQLVKCMSKGEFGWVMEAVATSKLDLKKAIMQAIF